MLYSLYSSSGHGEGVFILPLIAGFPGGDILFIAHSVIWERFFSQPVGVPTWGSSVISHLDYWTSMSSLFLGGLVQYYFVGWLIDRVKEKLEPKDEPLWEMPEDRRDPK